MLDNGHVRALISEPQNGARAMTTLEDCYRFADEHKDNPARPLLTYAACTAADYRKKLAKLAWACKESSKAKRSNTLAIVLMELEHY
jgi:hypothetical protein